MMKKIIVSILLAYSTVASAGTYYLDDAKKMKVDTPYNLMVMDGVTDLEMASHIGKADYIGQALKADPELVKKINSVMGKTHDAPLGFNSKDVNMLKLMLSSDPELLSRKNADNRNILINLLVQYFEFHHSDEPKKEVEKFIKQLETKKFPYNKDIETALTKGRPKAEMEQYAVGIANILSPQALNEADKWGNTALSYSVYIRNINLVKFFVNNTTFKATSLQNYLGENALFMLLNNNCNVATDKNTEVAILRQLLSARLNPLQKNEKGYSFAGIVFAFDEYKHYKDVLIDQIGPLRVKIAEREALQVKTLLEASNSKAVKDSLISSFSNSREYTIYTCDMNKLKY